MVGRAIHVLAVTYSVTNRHLKVTIKRYNFFKSNSTSAKIITKKRTNRQERISYMYVSCLYTFRDRSQKFLFLDFSLIKLIIFMPLVYCKLYSRQKN